MVLKSGVLLSRLGHLNYVRRLLDLRYRSIITAAQEQIGRGADWIRLYPTGDYTCAAPPARLRTR